MNNKYIESYQSYFKTPIGAYSYLLINQHFPEMFVISSDDNNDSKIGEILEKKLRSVTNIKEILKAVTEITKEDYQEVSSIENEINKNKIKNLIKKVDSLKLSSKNWNALEGIINFNNFGSFIHDKKKIKKKLKKLKDEYHLKFFSLNPNYHVDDFLNKFEKDIKTMCQILNIEAKNIGLDVLEINYQTEEGDFNGYVDYSAGLFNTVRSKMVIKNIETFTHEWLHFIDSALGIKMLSFTESIKQKTQDLKKNGLIKTLNFEHVINSKNNNYSKESFNDAFLSLARMLEKYALNKKTYNKDIKNLGNKFLLMPTETEKNMLIKNVKKLFNSNYPERYLSFIKAQCDIYQDKINKKRLTQNHMISFSKKADKYLKEEDYTKSHIETFARTFESYVKTKLENNNLSSNLLALDYKSDLYPQGDYKLDIDKYWDNAWPEMQKIIQKEMNKKNTKNNIISNINTMRNMMFINGEIQFKK